ncbi:hypothetical protein [Blastopirellula marina]|uniref:Uncharacterized protein n=1 Tax=Blastopirellula marina TaxID=124 RepID=A0A2S8GP82_9BACT|nr:hypothetical protein [Blastopirellula marina]PQO46232.1 hypothetical protein C5Y93_09610 [Blastopirellula marina]
MKNDFSKSAIPLLIFNFVCLDVGLIAASIVETNGSGQSMLNTTMGVIWGQYALACAARLRFPEYRFRTTFWLVAIPLVSVLVYPVIDRSEQLLLISTLLLMSFALTALFCLAPATIIQWLYGRGGRQLGIKHLLVFTCVFAVASFASSQLDFVGPMMIAFTLFALPSIVACLMLSLPDRPILYSVSMVLFLALGWGMLRIQVMPGWERVQEIFYGQGVCLLLGGQYLLAAGRSAPHELDRPEVADDIEPT